MSAFYPCSIWSPTVKTNKVDLVDSSHINQAQDEVVAIQNQLSVGLDSDGTIKSGTSFPSPAKPSQIYWRTDLNQVYIFTGTAWSVQSGVKSFTAGDYLVNGAFRVGVNSSSTTPTKVLELYLPRSGALRIKFYLAGNAGTAFGQIYRNGAAVGTLRSNVATTGGSYSEDISGWSAGELCQLYVYNSSSANDTYGVGLALYEGDPETVGLNVNTYPITTQYTSTVTPGTWSNSLGNVGDTLLATGGGASTTLYVKTGASTWTAK